MATAEPAAAPAGTAKHAVAAEATVLTAAATTLAPAATALTAAAKTHSLFPGICDLTFIAGGKMSPMLNPEGEGENIPGKPENLWIEAADLRIILFFSCRVGKTLDGSGRLNDPIFNVFMKMYDEGVALL